MGTNDGKDNNKRFLSVSSGAEASNDIRRRPGHIQGRYSVYQHLSNIMPEGVINFTGHGTVNRGTVEEVLGICHRRGDDVINLIIDAVSTIV